MLRKLENELFLFIDSIRKKKHLTQEELSFGVIDPRLYRKYLTGEVKAPIEVINLLVDKLGFRFESFMREFSKQQSNESDIVNKLLFHVINHDYKTAQEIINDLNIDSIIQKENLITYNISLLFLNFYTKKINETTVLYKMKKLINYPDILAEDTISLIEGYSLGFLLEIVDKNEKIKIASKLEKIMTSPDSIIYGENIKILNLTLFRLIKYFDLITDYQYIRKLCYQGIKNCHTSTSFYLLDYFYYFLAYAEKELGNQEEYEKNIFLSFSCISATQNDTAKKTMYLLLESDLNQNIYSFICDYLKKTYK